MKAKIAPAATPGPMIGSVTRRNAVQGLAPRLRAASSSAMSKLKSAADTVPIT